MKRFLVALLLLPSLASLPAAAQTVDDPRNLNGVWLYKVGSAPGVKGEDRVLTYAEFARNYPFMRGVLNPIPWRNLEPQRGRIDWESFDKSLSEMASAGLYINLMIWVGPHSPEWIYTEAGVRRILTSQNKGGDNFAGYPDYLDSTYRRLWFGMLDAVADHLDHAPAYIRNKVVLFQSAEGTTGDETPFKGVPFDEDRKDLNSRNPVWTEYRRAAWQHLYDLYASKKNLKVHVLINGDETPDELAWTAAHTPGIWRKANPMGHYYQANGEAAMLDVYAPLVNEPVQPGNVTRIRCRDEFDVHLSPSYDAAPAWFTYWTCLHALHFGVDLWSAHNNKELFDPGNAVAYRFFDKYGGQKDPRTSPGAFCALRDGLDAADTLRFPVSQYGTGSAAQGEAGRARALAIAAAFAGQGARQDDPPTGQGGPVNNYHAKALNDVGWNLFPGNFERYLHQWNPDGTSVGYWRVGDPKQPEGRFARGFAHASGKDTLYFDLHDSLFAGTAPRRVTVRISYFDNEGAWALCYDAAGGMKTALRHQNGNTNTWKELTVELSDAVFVNRLPHGCDLLLANNGTAGKDALFHLIEVTKNNAVKGAKH